MRQKYQALEKGNPKVR